MTKRGRKTTSEQSKLATISERRPAPPGELNPAQAAIWQKIVATKPGDWFSADNFPILIAYCKHIAQAAVLDEHIEAMQSEWLKDPDGLERYRQLLSMREKETRAQLACARSLRLTQQSRYRAEKAATVKTRLGGKMPWDQ